MELIVFNYRLKYAFDTVVYNIVILKLPIYRIRGIGQNDISPKKVNMLCTMV